MKRIMVNLLIGIGLIAIFIIVVAPFMFLYMHMHPPRLQNMFVPANFNLDYENLSIQTSDKVNLKGWYIPVKNKKGTMLVCHGVAANKSDVIQVSLLFNSAGYDVYTFDFRGHGETKEGNVTYGYDERKDVKAIIGYIKSKGVDKIGAY